MQTNIVQAFSAAGPRVSNSLPTDIRQLDLSYSRFRQSLMFFFWSVGPKHSARLSARPRDCGIGIPLLGGYQISSHYQTAIC